MKTDVVTIGLDTTLLQAITICVERNIRHLPVLSEERTLVGLVTDRDLRRHLSPRIGTISENNSDRESLSRHAHVIMVRKVVTGSPQMTLAEGARLMLENRVGCLPILDPENRVVGIVTTADFLRVMADSSFSNQHP